MSSGGGGRNPRPGAAAVADPRGLLQLLQVFARSRGSRDGQERGRSWGRGGCERSRAAKPRAVSQSCESSAAGGGRCQGSYLAAAVPQPPPPTMMPLHPLSVLSRLSLGRTEQFLTRREGAYALLVLQGFVQFPKQAMCRACRQGGSRHRRPGQQPDEGRCAATWVTATWVSDIDPANGFVKFVATVLLATAPA